MEVKQINFVTDEEAPKCVFCMSTEIDEIKFGPMYTFEAISAHHHCMLLAPNLIQNARSPKEGVLGFLTEDILKEVRRGSKLTCSFCKKKGATIGCIQKCKVKFHLPCGLANGTMHQFFDSFASFCAKHRPVQEMNEIISKVKKERVICVICQENIVACASHNTLWAPCCQKNAFFHRSCIQNLAYSAGYFFKCPLCFNADVFKTEMEKFGIYIPLKDAAWECVPNAYEELYKRHNTCDCETCLCPTGSHTDKPGTMWELLLCKYCGSTGAHVRCANLPKKKRTPQFTCETCAKIV